MAVSWGVWGCGGIARRRTIPEGIVPAINATLGPLYNRSREATKEIAAQYGVQTCDCEEDLLLSKCDVIYIATPVHLHAAQARRAAEAGKHVFCEKPLGLNIAEAEEMTAVCRANGVKLGTAMMMRFHAQHQAAQELVSYGQLGTPVYARAQLSCWYPPIEGAWRQHPTTGGGGALMDLGSHCLDLLEMFFGPIARVSCSTARLVQGYESEDSAVVLVDFRSGARGTVNVLFNVPDASSRNRLELYGSQGCILAEGTIGQGEEGEMSAYLEADVRGYEAGQSREAGTTTAIKPKPVNTYRAEVEAFSAAVIDDSNPPVDGEAGIHIQKLLAACYESARRGVSVEIE